MKIISTLLVVAMSLFGLATNALGISSIFQALKGCEVRCHAPEVCEIERDKDFRWCLANCQKGPELKEECEEVVPHALRPILPYEKYAGPYNTNQVSWLALKTIDKTFIEQTADRRRAVGTAKLLLLVHHQLVEGHYVQIGQRNREKLAEQLWLKYLAYSPLLLKEYQDHGYINDEKLSFIYDDLRRSIKQKAKY